MRIVRAMRAIRVATRAAAVSLLLSAWMTGSALQTPPTAQPVQTQSVASATAAHVASAAEEDKRTAKQKQLDEQAQKLVTMANELKAAVDKTNKNILSLDVVRKAGDIEVLAHQMREQSKR